MLPPSFTPVFLKQLELFTLRSRRAYLGTRQGGHLSPKRGHGIEFSDYRKYELGDSPRWIDWGVFARTDRLYVRRYQEEENLSVMVILDTSASMTTPREDRKWERAVELALALSYVALISQDTVVLSPLGHGPGPQFHGARAIHSAGKFLSELNLETLQNRSRELQVEIQRSTSRIRFPGLCILISDFLMPLPEIRSAFTALLGKNLDVAAIQVLGDGDINPFGVSKEFHAVDSETGEDLELSATGDSIERYTHLLGTHNRAIQQYCSSWGIRFSTVRGGEVLGKMTLSSLTKSGLLA